VGSRPRLLILVTLAEPGGAQAYVSSLLPALVDPFDVTVAAHGAGPLVTAARDLDVEFVELRYMRRPMRPWLDVLALAELVLLMRRQRPQIVHANSAKAGALGRLAAWLVAVPVRVYTVHGWAFLAHRGAAAIAFRWMERLLRPLTTISICISNEQRAAGIEAHTCKPEQAVVIRNGIDPANRPVAQERVGIPRIVSVGRLRAPKDPLTLLRALADLPPASFHASLVGDGPDRAAVEAERTRLGLESAVELLGNRDDVPSLLADADVFVLSSASEAFPISVLEAMAAQLPVVASAVGGIPELVVHDETGLLVAPGDPHALASALARLIDDRALRRRFGIAGRTRVCEHFDLASVQRAHRELYVSELAKCGVAPVSP
jgi:glycosyltransferase involved in cell wall biosynthesis